MPAILSGSKRYDHDAIAGFSVLIVTICVLLLLRFYCNCLNSKRVLSGSTVHIGAVIGCRRP